MREPMLKGAKVTLTEIRRGEATVLFSGHPIGVVVRREGDFWSAELTIGPNEVQVLGGGPRRRDAVSVLTSEYIRRRQRALCTDERGGVPSCATNTDR